MKSAINFIITSILLIFFNSYKAQDWIDLMQNENSNFYEIQSSFNNYWKDKDSDEKGKGYKVFKRWENFVERRVYPSGNLSQLNLTHTNYQNWIEDNNSNKLQNSNTLSSPTWTAIGPMGAISGNASGQLLKSGRLNFITISPTNTNVLWVGAPAGGLWKSTNGGNSWTTNTDALTVNGCTDLAIDPNNNNIMYLATGDGNAGDTRTIGILKSTDGGNTWSSTGFTNPVTNYLVIRRLIINPSNSQILLSAHSGGISRTTNGGNSWTTVTSSNSFDLEFHPTNSNIVYSGGTTFRRSTDGGVTWTTINSGITTTGVNRMAVAVTPTNPNVVYVIASSSSNSGFFAFYRSLDSGLTFSAMATSTPNLLGWSSTGNDTGGQGWYDLCIAASPTNSNEVVVGGVNVWRTLNGGSSWSLYGHWTGTGAPFTHADHHDLEYTTGGTLFNCNDGTVYRRTSTSWQEICGLMNISQIYKIGLSSLTPNLWITGHQDNGTSTWNGTTYQARIGGDGMDCFIDRTNNNNIFGETQNGGFRRSQNGGTNWSTVTTGLTGTAPWVTIWKQDPVVSNRIYCGRQNMFVSNDLATSWTQIGTLPVTGNVVEFAISSSNNQVIYVIKSNAIMKTTNAGTSWTNITGTLSVNLSFANVCVSPTDANKVWVVSGNYTNGNKVFYSSNGGSSWINISSNLPNIPGNCLLYEPGSNDRIYVGMDVGVYYRDAQQSTWTLYNNGLPNTPVSDMEISPAMPGKIVAATYGRGVWMTELATSSTPISSFTVSGPICTGVAKQFTNTSTGSPTSYTWSSQPTTGVVINSTNSANPLITFNNSGNFTISLVTANSLGTGNTHSMVITVSSSPNLTVTSSKTITCGSETVNIQSSGANSYTLLPVNLSGSLVTISQTSTTNYTVIGTALGCNSQKTISINHVENPQLLTESSNTLICIGQSATLTVSGAATYSWNTGQTTQSINVSPSQTTTYTVWGYTGNCTSSVTIIQPVISCIGIDEMTTQNNFTVYPNPFSTELNLVTKKNCEVEIRNVLGQTINKFTLLESKTIETDKFSEGLYIISIKVDGFSRSIKLTKSNK